MFKLYIIHPTATFNVSVFRSFDTLDSAIDVAFDHIAGIVPCCSVWIECNGDTLRLMN